MKISPCEFLTSVLYGQQQQYQHICVCYTTHQLLYHADYVNILGGSIHTLKENADALVAATREIGLEVIADKI